MQAGDVAVEEMGGCGSGDGGYWVARTDGQPNWRLLAQGSNPQLWCPMPGNSWTGSATCHMLACLRDGSACLDSCTYCHTEIDASDQACFLTQSQWTDTRPASLSIDPITSGAWQGSHWSTNCVVASGTRPGTPGSIPGHQWKGGRLTASPPRAVR